MSHREISECADEALEMSRESKGKITVTEAIRRTAQIRRVSASDIGKALSNRSAAVRGKKVREEKRRSTRPAAPSPYFSQPNQDELDTYREEIRQRRHGEALAHDYSLRRGHILTGAIEDF